MRWNFGYRLKNRQIDLLVLVYFKGKKKMGIMDALKCLKMV
jgi:hypothetical protein